MVLICETQPEATPVLPAGYTVRAIDFSTDIEELGKKYFDSYEPGVAWDTIAAATNDIRASVSGAYGEIWPQACLVVIKDSEIVGSVMTVLSGPWEDIPDCPFIIELFTGRSHRRHGLARFLVHSVLSASSNRPVSLRVDENNTKAIGLYTSLGFTEWNSA